MTSIDPEDNYGLGISSEQFPQAVTWLGQDGSYGGYETKNWTDPKGELTITVTMNLGLVKDGKKPGVARQLWNAGAKAYDAEYGNSRPAECGGQT